MIIQIRDNALKIRSKLALCNTLTFIIDDKI